MTPEERNQVALEARMSHLEDQLNKRIERLERQVLVQSHLLDKVIQTVGTALHEVRGSGATVADDGD